MPVFSLAYSSNRQGNVPRIAVFSWENPCSIDVKKRFFNVFLFWSRFCEFLKHFFIFQTLFIFTKNVGKVQSGKQINKKHFQSNSNEIDL